MLASCSFQTWNRNVGAKTLLGFCLGAFPRFGWSTAFASLFFLRFRLKRRKRRKKRGVFLCRSPRVGPRDHERSNPGLSYAILSGFMNHQRGLPHSKTLARWGEAFGGRQFSGGCAMDRESDPGWGGRG